MNKIYCLLLIPMLFLSCKPKPETFVEYDFQIESFKWDSNPYKFTSYIQDSIMETQGPQIGAWEFSYIGDIENMHKAWDGNSGNRADLSQSLKDSFALFNQTNAKDYILEKAKDHRIVIINEAHHMPQHRAFTTQLIEGLWEQGYKHLGLETYYNSEKNDSTLQANGYPTLKTGYYTKEPQFGNLVRVAHQKGLKLFGYESEGHQGGKEREINQAKNIQKYLAQFPNEKVIIHCGFDHGYEGDLSSSWEKAMAGRLTEFTDIDPLTINQTTFSERSKIEYESPYYRLADLQTPSVFLNEEDQSFGKYKEGSWFDISVFHPRSETFNRPKWMVYGDREEVEYSFEEAEIQCPCLVFAYKSEEKIGSAVPYDIQATNAKEVKLVLDKSDFDIIIMNSEGKALHSKLTKGNR